MQILKEHKEILLAQSDSKTLPEWQTFFNYNYSRSAIYSFCWKNDCRIKKIPKQESSKIQSKNARKYYINEDYFKRWTHNMAYTLGLWWADGCIYRGCMFDITQHRKDKYILKQIAKDMQYQGELYDAVDTYSSRINFSCVIIYNDIRKLGGAERKSLTAIFPKDIPDEFLPDFIRGYFDGDGSVWYVKDRRINSNFSSGSKIFLKEMLKVLKEKAGVENGSIAFCNSTQTCYHLTFGKKDSIKLGEYMYKNNPEFYLLRKKQKFDRFPIEEENQ